MRPRLIIHIALVLGAFAAAPPRAAYASGDGDERRVIVAVAVVGAALSLHGIYTFTRRRPPRPPPPPPRRIRVASVSASLVATPVSDGHAIGAGLGLAGRF